MKLCIQEILDKKGKARDWLQKQMNMNCKCFKKLINNEVVRIRFVTIEKLCTHLECTPNEMFVT